MGGGWRGLGTALGGGKGEWMGGPGCVLGSRWGRIGDSSNHARYLLPAYLIIVV